MKKFLRSKLAASFFGAALMLYAQIAAAPLVPAPSGWAPASQYVPGEVLVKFKPASAFQARAESVAARGHAVLAQLERTDWMHVKLGVGQSVEEALAAYKNDPDVETAQPNYIYRASAAPNDPQYGQLWAFKNTGQSVAGANFSGNPGTSGDDMNIEPAWGHITDCSSVIVAVVDSGVNYNQEDLAPNMWDGSGAGFPNHGFDFVSSDNDPMDLNGHGTHVAGIIGARGNNSTGTTGVCWIARIMAVRVLDAGGSGSTVGIIQGVNFAVAHGAKVINMSLGGPGLDPAFSNAITSAQNSDVVVVVAAGNDGTNNDSVATPIFPCNFTQANLVCVAALDQNYALASFSNFGSTSVDVGAPGTNVLSSYAGTTTTITDNFGRPGPLNWTTSGTGWANGTLGVSGINFVAGATFSALVNPSTYPSGTYASSQDSRAYKNFNLTGASAATLDFFIQVDISNGDALNINYKAAGGDPFAGGGTQLAGGPGSTGGIAELTRDISPCIGATCTVGFQLTSDAVGPNSKGAGIVLFSIQTLTLNTNSYQIDTGTSMASPMVAGLAAMLRAYNPSFTYLDTVNAIKNGGRPVAALTGKTTSGRAVDATSTLAFINPPTGLSAAVQ